MNKHELIDAQPIVTHILSNALKNNRLSHAYLFSGKNGNGLMDYANLLAKSFISDNKDDFGFANEDEFTQRFDDGNFVDFIIVDGTCKAIKKEDILNLQQQFSTTAMEKYGKKVYVINGIENSSSEAINALLKFLEEPSSNNQLAILITYNLQAVLPTIISRCQVVHFKPLNKDIIYNNALQYDNDNLKAYLVSQLIDSNDIQSFMEGEDFNNAYGLLQSFLKIKNNEFTLKMIELENDYILSKSKKSSFTKNSLGLFYAMVYQIYKADYSQDYKFKSLFVKIELHPKSMSKWLLILCEAKEKCNGSFYLPLIYEQSMIALSKEV